MLDNQNQLHLTSSQQLLAAGNKAFLEGDYALAIRYFEAAQQQVPAMASIIAVNIARATSKLSGEIGLKSILPIAESAFSDEALHDEITPYAIDETFAITDRPKCLLCVDSVSAGVANGWALDTTLNGHPIVIELAVNEVPITQLCTSLSREDVKQVHGGDGLSGFSAKFNRFASFTTHAKLVATPINHDLATENQEMATMPWPALFAGVNNSDIEGVAEELAARFVKQSSVVPSVGDVVSATSTQSIIIVNHNQLLSLQACLLALLRYNSVAEIIIVDQASTDGSVAFLQTFSHPRVTVLLQSTVLSFSESANMATAQATGDVFIFMSPQVHLTQDTVTIMANEVAAKQYAVVSTVIVQHYTDKNSFSVFSEEATLSTGCNTFGVHLNGLAREDVLDPFTLSQTSFANYQAGVLLVPAVSDALLAISRAAFDKVHGFSINADAEHAVLALCLAVRQQQQDIAVLLAHRVYQLHPLTGNKPKTARLTHQGFNALQNAMGPFFRREFRQAQFVQPGFWHHKPLAIAMIVSEVSLDTDKADFFTAKELGDALELEQAVVVGYFDENTHYDMTGYDVVFVYVDSFDPRRLKNLSPHCVVIGWARNWFDSWCDRPWIEHYDMLYASSSFAQSYMQQRLKRQVGLLRIAASSACLQQAQPAEAYKADYVFTGSYFHSPREITDALQPQSIPFEFKLFGHNWAELPHFGQYSSGPVSYTEIPKVYASARLVVDDANIATKKWGALNCRVYDALAAGIPCITNNQLGVAELFENDFPTYTVDNLNERITGLLSDNTKLAMLAKKYAAKIRAEHTYPIRAKQLLNDVKAYVAKKKLAIKIAAPDFERGVVWGDYYFARALRNEFEQAGYAVRIDCLDQWYADRSLNDDTNLVLRGLTRFKTRQDQQNLLWIISHPDLICEEELRDYQQIFVASELYQRKLQQFTGLANIESLLQASSFKYAALEAEQLARPPQHDILFIGNSRDQYREVVRWCVEENLPIAVYGAGWEQFIPAHYIKGQFISNDELPGYYHNATVVLNDHWPDMLRQGFVSNRVFDVLCAGGVVLSDEVFCESLAQTPNYFTYKNKADFLGKISTVLADDFVRQQLVLEQVSFKARAASIIAYL